MRTHAAAGLLAAHLALVAGCGEGASIASSSFSSASSSTGAGVTGSGAGGGCAAPNTQLDGALDGAAVGEAFFSAATSFSDEGEVSVTSSGACGGGLFFVTPTAPPADGGAQAFTGLFRMPAQGPGGGAWFCADHASATDDETPGVDFSLASLSTLGACAGDAVAGVVDGCLGPQGSGGCEDGGDSSLVSTLAGATFSWSNPARGYVTISGPDGSLELLTGIPSDETDGAGSRLYVELDGAGAVTGGVLLLGPGGPDARGVYCVGGGTSSGTAPRRFTLTRLSRLGACGGAHVAGSVAGHKKG